MIGPARTMPRAAADRRAGRDQRRSSRRTRSRGNSSRMIPKASGKMAPPTPWSTRAAIISASELARPRQRADGERDEHDDERALLAEHVAEAAERSASPTEAVSRYAVKIQAAGAASC